MGDVEQPYWMLGGEDEDEDEPSIDVVVPHGSRVEAKGNEVRFFDAGAADDSHEVPREGARSGGGRVKLPVGVSPEGCEMNGQKIDSGGQVVRCKLERKDVKRL